MATEAGRMTTVQKLGLGVVGLAGAVVLKSVWDRRTKKWLVEPVPMSQLDPAVATALEQAARDHKMVREPFDGCLAALTVAYQFVETVFIYPITPTTPLGEGADQWACAGKTNAFGVVPRVQQMQSEAGAAAAVHGTLVIGGLSTTFTASQGLLLMIPNLYKIAGELLPCVLHVAARALAGQALSIFGDHSDVMAVRQTGMALLSSHSVQESLDMALVAHIATHLCSIPFIHFFDGMRTSHEISKIETFSDEHMKVVVKLLSKEIDEFRARALNPNHPSLRGTAQSGDIYFQNVEAANRYQAAVPEAVRTAMQWVSKLTGRSYDLFEYYGHPAATDIIVIMGSGATVLEELLDHYGPARKVGIVKIHLFRPWSAKHFLAAIPSTVRRIAVLDRCKETGLGEPLFTDVCATLQACHRGNGIVVIGGRYGLASKDFTTGQAHAVFLNLQKRHPQHPFTVGIEDDVTHLSLSYTEMNTVSQGTVQSLLFGFGSDGTVGANKNAIKLIAKHTDLYAQGYFAYDALKAGGITSSKLRFGP
jgi:homodimeric pyruvate:ferredoxin (flavodoxin) oxidoreductase